jgi:HEPN domain-containing protein
MTVEHYSRLHGKYLADAAVLLEAKDYPQASEKMWGAVAQMIKLLGVSRRWRHTSHADLRRIVREIAMETQDVEFARLFSSAERLHVNFYEDFLPPGRVHESADNARLLIAKIAEALGKG